MGDLNFSSLTPGIWVSTEIIRIKDSSGEACRYVTVSPLKKIDDVRPIRVRGGAVQVFL